ncbi:replicative DNA helicase [Actinomycetospora termitidis]|uniref:DNA 5'-3' helicase n=1 Tax=Actinomycetospora termitidis TaxID=3053470 RepID=A0ABT7MHV6_9PSEU|nr:replicative DNA helicase [Actinomycetospora sp. Odt1-22]MDL5159467.1 replicative DNA helicase [Actinomycetospora sp. Odt1-22]
MSESTVDEYDDDRPRDLAAERAVLGAMLLSRDAIATADGLLNPDDFYRPAHGALFCALVGEWESDRPTDLVSLMAKLDWQGELAALGGPTILHTLYSESQWSPGLAEHWCGIVADHAARARLADLGARLRQLGTQSQADVGELYDRAREALDQAGTPHRQAARGTWVSDFMEEHLAAYDEPLTSGVLTGLPDLDEMLGGGRGVLPGQMIVVAARPGVGKSVFMTAWALRAAHGGHPAVIFSLEMSRPEVTNRLVAAQAQVRIDAIEGRRLDQTDRGKYLDAGKVVAELPLAIEDDFEASLSNVRATARAMARTDGLGIVFLDYLQLLDSTDGRAERDRRVAVDGFSRGMKLLAKELDMPVVVLSQLNRGIENRQDKTPQLSDLRESGALEQDAHIVLMLDRPDSRERDSPRAGELDVHVVKNRNGPKGVVTVAHRMHLGRVESLAPSWSY